MNIGLQLLQSLTLCNYQLPAIYSQETSWLLRGDECLVTREDQGSVPFYGRSHDFVM